MRDLIEAVVNETIYEELWGRRGFDAVLDEMGATDIEIMRDEITARCLHMVYESIERELEREYG